MEDFDAESIVSKVSDFCNRHQIPLSQSSIAIDGSLTSNAEHSVDLDSLLSFVLAIRPTFVSISQEKIDGRDFHQQLEDLECTDAKLYDELSLLKSQINKIGQIEICFFSDFGSVLHSWKKQSRVYELIHGQSDLGYDDDEDFDDSYKYISDEEIEQYAKKVSLDPKLEKSDTLASIKIIIQKELKGYPKKVLTVHIESMARMAQALYRTEIQPQRDDELAERAMSLRDQGLKKLEIAKQLKISTSKLNKII